MYRPTSSTPSDLAFTNGSLATPNQTLADSSAVSSDSESDLSDAIDPPASSIKPSPLIEHNDTMASPDDGSNVHGYSSEDAMGSEDGEYDSEPPLPPPQRVATSESPCSTQSSSTYGKRKASVEPDDYNENPELYGLRRSVCLSDTMAEYCY